MKPDRPRSAVEELFADKVPARIFASGTGLLVGGPVGAIGGAALAPALEFVLKRGNDKFAAAASAVLTDARKDLGLDEEQFVAYLEGDERRLELGAKVAAESMQTLNERKLRTLSNVLRFGLSDDARLDVASIVVAGVAGLEPAHIQVLDWLVRVDEVRQVVDVERGRGDVRQRFERFEPGLHLVLAGLESAGIAKADDRGVWHATYYGVSLCAWLRADGPLTTDPVVMLQLTGPPTAMAGVASSLTDGQWHDSFRIVDPEARKVVRKKRPLADESFDVQAGATAWGETVVLCPAFRRVTHRFEDLALTVVSVHTDNWARIVSSLDQSLGAHISVQTHGPGDDQVWLQPLADVQQSLSNDT